MWINHKTRPFSVSSFGPFKDPGADDQLLKDQNNSFPYPFMIYTWSLKKIHLWVGPHSKGHYREYATRGCNSLFTTQLSLWGHLSIINFPLISTADTIKVYMFDLNKLFRLLLVWTLWCISGSVLTSKYYCENDENGGKKSNCDCKKQLMDTNSLFAVKPLAGGLWFHLSFKTFLVSFLWTIRI